MATPNIWSDFENVLAELRSLTVVYLKHVISGFSEEGVTSLPRTGKKGEIMDRIVRAVRLLQTGGQADKWIKARAVILQAASGIEYDHGNLSRFLISATPAPITNGEVAIGDMGRNLQPPTPTQRSAPSHSSTGPQLYPSTPRSTYPVPGPSRPEAPRWRFSPFYRIEQAVSTVQECPESTSSTDRRSTRFNFYLTQDHIAKLNSTRTKYQLRLYCTTSQYYITIGTAFRNNICPVEFPPTCEVRVNTQSVHGNFRGIKKKAGTAPPADITKLSRIANGHGNQVEMIYVNSNQPAANKRPPPQKYYLVVNLVEVTSVEQLVERLKKRVQSREEVIARMKANQPDDDDVQVGPTRVSLRDPLTYTRITLPCRASSCVHIGCFDAACWYSMMEQTTTWLCPICDHVLDVNELVIDGYMQEILANVDEEADDVMIEADGEWHTEDNKFGSAHWMSIHGAPVDAHIVKAKPDPTAALQNTIPAVANAIEIDDSSDSEEEQIKRELSPVKSLATTQAPRERRAPIHSGHSTSSAPLVIDLTLSDSEDEGPPPPPSRSVSSTLPPMPPSSLGKRKLSDDGDLGAGSSRRTSTAPSHRSNGVDGDDYSHPQAYYYQNHSSLSHRSPTSPSMPRHTSNGSSPGVYPYHPSKATPSPTAQSPNQQWQAPTSFRNQITLPPASSLLASAPLPNVPSLPARPQLSAQEHYAPGSRLQRPLYEDERRPAVPGASSRYAEWGLKP